MPKPILKKPVVNKRTAKAIKKAAKEVKPKAVSKSKKAVKAEKPKVDRSKSKSVKKTPILGKRQKKV